jgi:predicted signal transduction protein with EAL and GGDEF domain
VLVSPRGWCWRRRSQSRLMRALLSDDLLASPDEGTAASVNRQLELLTGSGSILRIKVWSPNGTVVFSDLKIDLSFVAALDTGREAPAVVRSIIRLAGTLGLRTIAEGIERPEQAGRLRTLGANYGQGYLFAPPLSAEELSAYLRESPWSPTATATAAEA